MSVPQPTREFLTEPEKDPELTPLGSTITVSAATPQLDYRGGKIPTADTVPAVGEYIENLEVEQRQLLAIALEHARSEREDCHHRGEVVFLKRTNPYERPTNWGLEIIDAAESGGEGTQPLYIVFIEPRS